jgi:hypothetical protein
MSIAEGSTILFVFKIAVFKITVLKTAVAVLLMYASVLAQDKPAEPQDKDKKSDAPQVKINYLNVCAPSADEQHVLDNALSALPSKPAFGTEFEVARGKSTMPEEGPGKVQASEPESAAPVSKWVRIRREFASGELANVQYTFSKDEKGMAETLVFRMKSPKRDQPLLVSLQDTLAAPTATQALAANAPPNRVRVERFGAASVVLARCPQADQKQYERFFARATALMASYRKLLGVTETVPSDLARVK